jgi:hypothetical protein
MKGELQGVRKEAVVAHFKELLKHVVRGTKKINKSLRKANLHS